MIDDLKAENPEPNRPWEHAVPGKSGFPIVNHRIRLRDFWTITTDGDRTRHARNFGRPRLNDATGRVWLVCESVPGAAEVFVNGRSAGVLGAAGPFAADVTELLLPRNAVVFAVTSDQPLGAVAIEIRTTAN